MRFPPAHPKGCPVFPTCTSSHNSCSSTKTEQATEEGTFQMTPRKGKKHRDKGSPVYWVDLIDPLDKNWKISDHRCILVPNSLDPYNTLCWGRVAANRTYRWDTCKYRHSSTPTTVGTKAEVNQFIAWVNKDKTLKLVGSTSLDLLHWIKST